ncbi:MAG: YbjN domain-containing protein [Alphaproteobacteria bacterium]|nr:YbjN domain-containing protein [Alphaproteobacteria bacterium]
MTESLSYTGSAHAHPIDLVEQIVGANAWSHQRLGDDELAVEVAGRWCDYRLFFAWHREAAAIHFSLALDMRVPRARMAEIGGLLAMINEKLWLGHFDLWSDDGLPMFRYAMLLRGTAGPSAAQIEELLDIAMSESDRFYPAFQFVIWGGKSAAEAVACALIDPAGEA